METCANLLTFSFPNATQCALHDARTRQDAVAENIMAQVCQDLTPQKIYTLPTFRLMTKDQKGIARNSMSLSETLFLKWLWRLRVYIEYSRHACVCWIPACAVEHRYI